MDRRHHVPRPPTDLRAYRRQRRRKARRGGGGFAGALMTLALLVAIISWETTPAIHAAWSHITRSESEIAADEASVYYPNCDAARAAGAAPILRGSPGYREGLDGDDDGIACEHYYRW